MSIDDFHVIAYRILQYLYDCMKKGISPDIDKIVAKNYEINERYFNQIIRHLYNNGFIDGVEEINTMSSLYKEMLITNDIEITLQGIEYLTDNTFIKKAQKFFKMTKEAVPFV